MTKEKLLARKAEAEKQRDQLVGQINGLIGIIQDCDYWLAELDKPAEVDDAA
jgi:hypothetical protein